MTTSTLGRPTETGSDRRPARRQQRRLRPNLRRMQERGAVMVHRHALPSVAVSLGAGLVTGLVIGTLLAQGLASRQPPPSLLQRSRRRMGDAFSNLSEMVPASYRNWRG